ncbi:MAG: flagellar hook-length control protein FliK [bacterium]
MESVFSPKLNIWKLFDLYDMSNRNQGQLPKVRPFLNNVCFKNVLIQVMNKVAMKQSSDSLYQWVDVIEQVSAMSVNEKGQRHNAMATHTLVPIAVNQTQLKPIDTVVVGTGHQGCYPLVPVRVAANQAQMDVIPIATVDDGRGRPLCLPDSQPDMIDPAVIVDALPAVVVQAQPDVIDPSVVADVLPAAVTQAQSDVIDPAVVADVLPVVVTQAQPNVINPSVVVDVLPAAVTQAQPDVIDPSVVADVMPVVAAQAQPNVIDPSVVVDALPAAVTQAQLDVIDPAVVVNVLPTVAAQAQPNVIPTPAVVVTPAVITQAQLNKIDPVSIDQGIEIMNKIKEGIERILLKNNNINMGMGNEQTNTPFNAHNEPLRKETFIASPWQNPSDLAKEVINKLVQEIKINLKDEITQMHIQLKPEHLGKLEFILSMEKEKLTATFLVQDDHVKELIKSNLEILRSALELSGINIGLINVFVRDEHLKNKQKREDLLSFGFRGLKEKKQQTNIDAISRSWMRGTIELVA